MSDAHAIYALRHRGKDREALIEIATILRREVPPPTPLFLRFLADLIDPRTRATFTDTKLELVETKARKKHRNDELRNFLEMHIDIFEEPQTEAVIAHAMDKFGCKRSHCFDQLKAARARQAKNPEMFADVKRTCIALRELGDPDYAPIAFSPK